MHTSWWHLNLSKRADCWRDKEQLTSNKTSPQIRLAKEENEKLDFIKMKLAKLTSAALDDGQFNTISSVPKSIFSLASKTGFKKNTDACASRSCQSSGLLVTEFRVKFRLTANFIIDRSPTTVADHDECIFIFLSKTLFNQPICCEDASCDM